MMNGRRKKISLSRIAVFLALLCVTAVFLLPFVWTFITSFKTDAEIYTDRIIFIPSTITSQHYMRVLTQMESFIKYFRNSVVISTISLIFVVIFSATMGYALSKLKFRLKAAFLGVILFIMVLPQVIYLMPIYIMQLKVNLIDTRLGVILPYIAINLPMGIFIMRGQFNSVPDELCEAGIIDGCNAWSVFSRVVLPCVKPGIATVIIFTFMDTWGEFTFARTLTSSITAQTLPVGIIFLRDEARSWAYGTLSATIVLAMLPVLVIFLSMQKYFVKGILEGALKG